MTAEIAIMNREAVALAADSAVTISQGGAPKIFASSNKLFALSRRHPVGVMVYGNASFMEVPWETVIKLYRARLGDTAYATIEEYVEGFISFLQNEPSLAPEVSQEMHVRYVLTAYYGRMLQEIETEFNTEFKKKIQEEVVPPPEEAPRLFLEAAQRIITWHYQHWKNAKYANTMGAADADGLRKQYRQIIRQAKESAFGSLLTPTTSRQLTRLAGWMLSKYADLPFSLGEAGIVIAGFGEEQIFPSIQSFVTSGIVGGRLKYQHDEGKSKDITVGVGARIIPFAQDEMVRSFMEGIEPDYWIDILHAVSRLLEEYPITLVDSIRGVSDQERERLKHGVTKVSQDVFQAFSEEFDSIKATRYIDPVVSTIVNMPKSELPAVAEALVNLQSFKRRVSREQETVGGPIDVMLISKGDGLIWIQRKHYFDPAFNPQYFQAAYRVKSDSGVKAEGAPREEKGR